MEEKMILETDRLIIRRFKPTDWEDLHDYLSDKKVIKFEPYDIFTKEESKKSAIFRASSSMFLAVVLKKNKKVIGNLYYNQVDPKYFMTWEMGFVFNSSYWKKGYAFEASKELQKYIFNELEAHRIIANCNVENHNSWKLLERLNMRREGHFKKVAFFKLDSNKNPIWHDSYLYSILNEEFFI